MKTIAFLLLMLAGVSIADDTKFGFLFVDSTVNKDLYSLVYPVPDKYPMLKATLISRTELDSLAKHEMGKVTVFQTSGPRAQGKYLDVGADGVSLGGNRIKFQDIDYLEYKERQSVGGFLGTVTVVAIFSGIFFGGMEAIHWSVRDEYDLKRVLVYSGAMTGIAGVFYFPSTKHRVGFKFKNGL